MMVNYDASNIMEPLKIMFILARGDSVDFPL